MDSCHEFYPIHIYQCLNFPHEGTKITVVGNPYPFQYCSNLRGTTQFQAPFNQVASSSHYIDASSLTKSPTPFTTSNSKVQVHDVGCGEYYVNNLLMNNNANVDEKVQDSNNDVKIASEGTSIDDHAWIKIFLDPDVHLLLPYPLSLKMFISMTTPCSTKISMIINSLILTPLNPSIPPNLG